MRCGSWQHPSAWASIDNSVSVWCPSMQAVVAQVALPCIRETSPSSSSAVLCNTHDGNGSVWTTISSILQGTDLDSEYTLCKFVCFLIKGGAAVPPPPFSLSDVMAVTFGLLAVSFIATAVAQLSCITGLHTCTGGFIVVVLSPLRLVMIFTLSFCWSWTISSWSAMSQMTTTVNSKLAN